MYALGGMGADTTPQALVRVYEAEKDQWQPMTSMPTPRYGATPLLRGNKIYVMGRRRFIGSPPSGCQAGGMANRTHHAWGCGRA